MKQFEFIKDEELRKHSSMRVGGKCDLYYAPTSIKELINVLNFAKKNKLKTFILGNGTNVIFKSSGYKGLIIDVTKLNKISIKKNVICAMAGVSLFKLNMFLSANSLSGLEWSFGIPGTIGGAIFMNAGAYGKEIGEFVEKVEVIKNGKLKIIKKSKLKFDYRNSSIKKQGLIITRVWLNLNIGDQQKILQKQSQYYKKRKLTQPIEYFNAGSIFKKVDGESAGKIIDKLGLKGVKIGGAEVSTLHGNFIINKNNATGDEVVSLIQKIKQEVYNKTGTVLEEEVIIVGE